MTVLSVKNVGKAFFSYRSEWQRFARWLGLSVKPVDETWVLRNIHFDIQPGDAVGVIGENGAGKSTLLKIITGTLRPTEGHVEVNGRIAAILELGMGFNPELTGRQNVRHAAGVMGFSTAQIDEAMGDIEAFAEIGEYFDQPLRSYSTGMQMRVAFAVATAWRPKILIVDEALSVGDIYFQHKCMQRIRSYKELGTALLLVSHSPDTIRQLCNRGIIISKGGIEKIGDVVKVMDYYRASQIKQMQLTDGPVELSESDELQGGQEKKIILANKSAGAVLVDILSDKNAIYSGDDVSIRIKVTFSECYSDPHIGFGIRNKMGLSIYEANTYTLGHKLNAVSSGDSLTVIFKFSCLLAPGSYGLMIGVADGGYDKGSFETTLFFDQSFILFEVAIGDYSGWSGLWNVQPKVING